MITEDFTIQRRPAYKATEERARRLQNFKERKTKHVAEAALKKLLEDSKGIRRKPDSNLYRTSTQRRGSLESIEIDRLYSDTSEGDFFKEFDTAPKQSPPADSNTQEIGEDTVNFLDLKA
jgi:hypothetical protein